MAKPNVNDPQWYSSFPKNEDGTPNMKKFQKEDFQKLRYYQEAKKKEAIANGEQPITTGPKATDRRVYCEFKYFTLPNKDEKQLRVYLKALHPVDVKNLDNQFDYAILNPKDDDVICFIFNNDQDFRNWKITTFPQIVKKLEEWGHSNEESLRKMEGRILDFVLDSDSEAAESKRQLFWKTFIDNFNDPEVKGTIELYHRLFHPRKYGHILSLKNYLFAKAQNPDVTLLMTREEWLKRNRKIKPRAKGVIITAPLNSKSRSKDEMEQGKNESGWSDYEIEELPLDAEHMVRVLTGSKKNYYSSVREYDIKETELIEGKEDIVVTQMGLISNLTGEINDLAKADEDSIDPESKPKKDDSVETRTAVANEAISDYCIKHKVSYNKSDNNTTNLINAIHAIAYKQSTTAANILKASNKDTFANMVVATVLFYYKIGFEQIERYKQIGGTLTSFEAGNIGTVVGNILSVIDNAYDVYFRGPKTEGVLNETFDIKTLIDKVLKLTGVKVVDEKEEISEQFNKMLQKINESVWIKK